MDDHQCTYKHSSISKGEKQVCFENDEIKMIMQH
uniref:Uncharacterized protein n=1 Tax=Arundo donax TaxID=35708 RepID=A0A0A9HEW1_ARUDO